VKNALLVSFESSFKVCFTNLTGNPGKYFEDLSRKIDCDALFASEDMDASSEFPTPPAKMPKWLEKDFTYNFKACI